MKIQREWITIGVAAVATVLSAGAMAGAEPPERVEVGQQAPNFGLDTLDGGRASLEELEGESPLILIFFRGTW